MEQLSWILCLCSDKAGSKVSARLFSSGGSSGEEVTSLFIHIVGRIYFLVTLWLKAQVFCWLLLGDYSQRPEANHRFLYLGSSDVIVYFIKFTRSFISSNLLRPSLMYHNAIIGLMYPHFGHVLFVKSKSQLSLTVQGKGLHKVVNTRKSGNSVHH